VRAFVDYVAGEVMLEHAPVKALPALQHAHRSARRIGNRFLAAMAGLSSVSCAARLGHPAEAVGEFTELIDHFHRTGSWTQQWTAVLYGALSASKTSPPVVGPDVVCMAEALAELRSRLGDDRLTELRAQGARMGDDLAIAYALRQAGPGRWPPPSSQPVQHRHRRLRARRRSPPPPRSLRLRVPLSA